MARLLVSRLAIEDLLEIESHSRVQWGKRVAAEYMAALEQGLQRLRETPGLLRAKSGVSDALQFYRVRQHFLVCAIKDDVVFVLTVKHGAMDLPERIGEMEPQLLQEVEILYRAARKNRKR